MKTRRYCPAGFFIALLTAGLALMASAAAAGDSAVSTKAAFEKLKGLAGEWRGNIDERGAGKEAAVTYKVTSGGSAVVETLFPGTEHEMVTVYYLEGDKLVLTHYCTVGNQPKMTLTKKSTAEQFSFDFAGGSNVNAKKDKHMHSMRMNFQGQDGVSTEWDFFADGKKAGTTKFFLTRKA